MPFLSFFLYNVSFFSGCLYNFLLITFFFWKFVSFMFLLLGLYWTFWIYRFITVINREKFQPLLTTNTFCSLLSSFEGANGTCIRPLEAQWCSIHFYQPRFPLWILCIGTVSVSIDRFFSFVTFVSYFFAYLIIFYWMVALWI